MSDEQLATIAFLSAGAAVGGYYLASRSLSQSAEPPARWYALTWPRTLNPESVVAFFRTLAGDRRRHVVALEAVGKDGELTYRLGLAEHHAEAILSTLHSYLPGVAAELIEYDTVPAPLAAWQLRISAHHRALRSDDLELVARSVVTALSHAGKRDTVVFQWLLGPRLTARHVANGESAAATSWPDSLKRAVNGNRELDAEGRRALRDKVGEPGFRAVCRLGINTHHATAAQAVANTILGALRSAESPSVRLELKPEAPERVSAARPLKDWPTPVNVRELAALVAWPLGEEAYPGVRRAAARLLKPNETVPEAGRIVARSTFPGSERPLALGPRDALQHLHVLGPTGVGKSTLLLNLVTQDIVAGRGVVVIDPKGDLVEDVLARIPAGRMNDVVVLDPADEERPVGLNVLRGGERSPELIADQVLAVFHGLYRENWGPRTQDILHASLLTLAGRPDMTLCALPVLLSNPRFRRDITKTLTDEIALKPFWSWYEALSEGERQQAIAPVMNKLRAFLLRPRMRAVIGQADPSFGLSDIFRKRGVLLVSLAKGLLGPEAAALLGSLVVSQLWQAALGRVRVPADRRSPVMVYVDEFQDYLHLPTDLADVLAQARGLGVGLTLAHQHLAQLPNAVRSAVLANARSRVCFQLSHEDAKLVAATTDDLAAFDLQGLGRYEAYVSLVADGNVTGFASARTLAPTASVSDPAAVRAVSRTRYGQDLADIEAGIAGLVAGAPDHDEHPIGRRRRA
ncbi:MAG: type IV secretory system conjugative DNA transfer family protein [Thermoleophilia bacterium]